jgi:hypothetical protein
MAIWNILRTFGKFSYHLTHFAFIWHIFSGFWYHVPTKIWQPCPEVMTNAFRVERLSEKGLFCVSLRIKFPREINHELDLVRLGFKFTFLIYVKAWLHPFKVT